MSGAKLNTFLKWQDSLEYLMLEKTPKKKKKKVMSSLHYSKNKVPQIYFELKSLPCKGIIIFGTSEQKIVVLKARRMTTQPGFGSEVSWIQSI